MQHVLVVFEVEHANYKDDRFVFEHGPHKLTAVAVASEAEALQAVDEFLQQDRSVTRIELCGGISSAFSATLANALPATAGIPIAGVAFGFEALDSVMAYKQAYIDGKELSQAFVYVVPGLQSTRIDKVYGQTNTALLGVPDEQALRAVARTLHQEGVGLIEVYGWVDNSLIATLIEHTGKGEIPVGHVAYPALREAA